MTRALIPIGTTAAVYLLADALASHDWAVAALLGVAVVCGICGMAPGKEGNDHG